MGSTGTGNVTYSNMSDTELTAAYDTAIVNRDTEAVTRILEETARRQANNPTQQTSITYTSKNVRRRGARGRR